jgi:hypothetical protein
MAHGRVYKHGARFSYLAADADEDRRDARGFCDGSPIWPIIEAKFRDNESLTTAQQPNRAVAANLPRSKS